LVWSLARELLLPFFPPEGFPRRLHPRPRPLPSNAHAAFTHHGHAPTIPDHESHGKLLSQC
jgi:hypothetical protein